MDREAIRSTGAISLPPLAATASSPLSCHLDVHRQHEDFFKARTTVIPSAAARPSETAGKRSHTQRPSKTTGLSPRLFSSHRSCSWFSCLHPKRVVRVRCGNREQTLSLHYDASKRIDATDNPGDPRFLTLSFATVMTCSQLLHR